MATGHSVIPVDHARATSADVIEFLTHEMVFAPETLPPSRFPTLTELRHAIHDLGYDLEEAHDWFVTSEDDFTEIWFSGGIIHEEGPVDFWFRRGHLIVLDIAQAIANQ